MITRWGVFYLFVNRSLFGLEKKVNSGLLGYCFHDNKVVIMITLFYSESLRFIKCVDFRRLDVKLGQSD